MDSYLDGQQPRNVTTTGAHSGCCDIRRITLRDAIEDELEFVIACFADFGTHLGIVIVEDVISTKLAEKVKIAWG